MVKKLICSLILTGALLAYGFQKNANNSLKKNEVHNSNIEGCRNKLSVQLLPYETNLCEDSAVWNYQIVVSTNSIIPISINGNLRIGTSQMEERESIWIRIVRNDSIYVSFFIEGRESLPKKKIITKLNPLRLKDNINFNNLINRGINNFSVKQKHFNKDFGSYQVQAVYVTNNKDSVFSNIVDLQYDLKCR